MKNITFYVMLFSLVSTVLFAGGNNENTSDSTETLVLVPETATTINMIGWRFPVTEFFAEELESFNSVDKLTVSTQLLDSQSVREQVRLALAGGGKSPYEIVQGDATFLTELAINKQILALDDYIEKYKDVYDFGDISDTLYTLTSPDGKIYGIPFTANSMHYFYNMDIFEEYNISVPETYADVIASAKKLKDADIDLPFAINLHAGWAWRIEFINFLNAFGGQWLSDEGEPLFNSKEGVAALEMILDIADATMGKEGLSWSIDDVEIGLETGRLASATTWTSRAANMDDPTKSQFVGRIGFAPAPRVSPSEKRAAPATADYYMIPINTTVDPEYIFRVIAEATDFESQKRGADYSLMTRNKVSEARQDVRYTKAALQSISEGGAVTSTHPGNPIAIAIADNYLPQAINRRDDIQGLLNEMADAYRKEATQQGVL